jgi:hypothetical protein
LRTALLLGNGARANFVRVAARAILVPPRPTRTTTANREAL